MRHKTATISYLPKYSTQKNFKNKQKVGYSFSLFIILYSLMVNIGYINKYLQ